MPDQPRRLVPGTPESYGRFLPGGAQRRHIARNQIGIVPKGELRAWEKIEPSPRPDDLDLLFDRYVAAAQKAFGPHSPFDVVGALALINVLVDTEQDEERSGVGLVAAGELGATIAVSSARATDPQGQATTSPGEAVWSVHDRLIACVLMSGAPGDDASADTSAHARFFAQTGVIRFDRLDHQEREQVESLFGPKHIAASCRAVAGFDGSEALQIYDAVTARYIAAFRAALADETDPTLGLGQALTVTIDALEQDTNLSRATVEAFVDAFAVPLGGLPTPRRADDLTTIRRKPLVRDGSRLICTVPANLLRAIRPALEDGVKSSGNWEPYQRQRRRFSEERTIELLSDFLAPDLAITGLSFGTGAVAGECDGLVVLDDTALVIEVKAGSVRGGRQSGSLNGFRGTIKDLIEYPIGQIARARTALLSGHALRDADGPLHIPFGHITRIYGIVVTLEALGFASPMLWQLEDEGLLHASGTLPWLVGLHELESICRILEFPAQLLHFLDAHQRMNALRCVVATDEIDVLMAYLDMGLRFDAFPPADRIILPADSDQLNAWMLYKQGIRTTPAPRPSQYFPMSVRLATRAALRRLNTERPSGFISESFEVIDAALDEADEERGVPRVIDS